MKKLLSAILLTVVSHVASAYTIEIASTLSNLQYTVNFPTHPLASCNKLQIDVTGDFENSSTWSTYGTLNCKNGTGYNVSGSAYIGTNGHIYLNTSIGLFARMNCDITANSCRLYEPTNNTVYTGTIR